MNTTSLPTEGNAILFVDDEPMACKWFARSFSNEFTILTAAGVSEALELLGSRGKEIALLVTDFRMPQRSGLELLAVVRKDYPHVVRLLASAYAEREVAIAAINDGQVFRILEKPLDEQATRVVLREAFSVYRQRSRDLVLQDGNSSALRETLGFLAHELNTPLATVRGYMEVLKKRLRPGGSEPGSDWVGLSEDQPGQIVAALDAAERSALHAQSLMSTFVQSARDAYPGAASPKTDASSLVQALLDEYPFGAGERERVSSQVEKDFSLPGRRNLLYLVLCTLTKNALYVLRDQHDGQLVVRVNSDLLQGLARQWIRFEDNGPGIEPELLVRLTHGPVSTRTGGSGMGLVFCRRVMQSTGGSIEITSEPNRGTAVTLYFPAFTEGSPNEAKR
jgi:two-component system response regulator PhcR